jgi:hypothetical protein
VFELLSLPEGRDPRSSALTPGRIPPLPTAGWPGLVNRPMCGEMMLDLTEEETDTLARLVSRTIDDDGYPLSPRIQNLKGILGKIRLEPVREPLPPPKVYEPPFERQILATAGLDSPG